MDKENDFLLQERIKKRSKSNSKDVALLWLQKILIFLLILILFFVIIRGLLYCRPPGWVHRGQGPYKGVFHECWHISLAVPCVPQRFIILCAVMSSIGPSTTVYRSSHHSGAPCTTASHNAHQSVAQYEGGVVSTQGENSGYFRVSDSLHLHCNRNTFRLHGMAVV